MMPSSEISNSRLRMVIWLMGCGGGGCALGQISGRLRGAVGDLGRSAILMATSHSSGLLSEALRFNSESEVLETGQRVQFSIVECGSPQDFADELHAFPGERQETRVVSSSVT